MSFGRAMIQTWQRAVVFGIFFLLLAMGLDLLFDRTVTWAQRGTTVVLGALVYWVLSAFMLKRQQGQAGEGKR